MRRARWISVQRGRNSCTRNYYCFARHFLKMRTPESSNFPVLTKAFSAVFLLTRDCCSAAIRRRRCGHRWLQPCSSSLFLSEPPSSFSSRDADWSRNIIRTRSLQGYKPSWQRLKRNKVMMKLYRTQVVLLSTA